MPYVISRRRVPNYDEWKRSWDEIQALRRAAGVKSEQLYRNPDDPNDIVVLREVTNLEEVRRFFQSPEHQQRIKDVGVTDRAVYYPVE